MILFEKTKVVGFEGAIRGMRNPKNSWKKSDSGVLLRECVNDICDDCLRDCNACHYDKNNDNFCLGENDKKLALSLAAGGPVHAKYRRMIIVYVDITAPLYWWKEFDTYKVGTVANSCSTMHKIHSKEFVESDFSIEHLFDEFEDPYALDTIRMTISALNRYRELYLETKDKKYWWQMIQLLPSSYNQKRTIMLSYEVLNNIYIHRKNHLLDEWQSFCAWIQKLPYSELIIRGINRSLFPFVLTEDGNE